MRKVSIIVPCYNAEAYLGDLIQRLTQQTYKNIEVILVNDGSKDATDTLCRKYEEKYPWVFYYKKENGGAASARNFGLERSTGDYLYFLDCDDWFEPEILEKMVACMEKTQADLAICGYYMELMDDKNSTKVKLAYSWKGPPYISPKEKITEYLVPLLEASLCYNVWNKLYRKEIIDRYKLHFEKITYVEDFIFNYDYIPCCNSVVVLSECLYHYIRERTGAVTAKYQPKLFEIRCAEHKKGIEVFKRLGLYERDGEEYLMRRFAMRVLGCIENEAGCSNPKPMKEKLKAIGQILHNRDVQAAFRTMNRVSRKVKMLAIPVKAEMPTATLLMGIFLSKVRSCFPSLFMKQKAKR